MDEERNPPFFPHRTQTCSACQAPALLSGLPPPLAPQQDNRMDGRTDGRTDRAQARRRGAGREGRRGSGGQRWVPPAPSPAGAPWAAPGRQFGDSFLFLSLPVRSAPGAAPAGWTAMALGEALTPPGSGSVASGARRHHRPQPQHPQPCAPRPSRPPEQRGEERRGEEGAASGGDPAPPPPLRPRPRLGRSAGAAFSLPSQPEAEGLFKFYFLFD